eukprot:CAMPEP_0172323730 /NCGR_PEP_ID=MMETSP1058-20130122/49450_1 /TAXON_ID=83371 /ORGANISM="Detonula confervacea, Strain CCMP 353" /LENGTH=628 /DNA_ID=CAMNT_0013039807 /DNA_START=16 /DNA_END=1902 /DNA_ORIENTATION=+
MTATTDPLSSGSSGGDRGLKRPRPSTMIMLPPSSIILSPPSHQRNGFNVTTGLVPPAPMPSNLLVPPLPLPTHPIPEFLCHLYSMLNDPHLSNLISWTVPLSDESQSFGGGKAGIGKIVVHDPTGLQNEVLGNYYRHSKYSSFQRQLNYFGFKKRMHGSKKGKMCPCSFVHDMLGRDTRSLLSLKRRHPSNNRNKGGKSGESISSRSTATATTKTLSAEKRPSPSKSNKDKDKKIKANFSKSSIPCNVSVAIGNNSASWCTKNQHQGTSTTTVPLNMPLVTQAAPGSAPWLNAATAVPSNTVVPGTSIPRSPSSSADTNKKYMSILHANNNILEAKKLLEMNFLKSQLEQQASQRAVVEPSCPIQPQTNSVQRSNVVVQQQQQQSSGQRSNDVVQQQQHQQQLQQQQQVQQQQLNMPNQYPSIHPFATMMDGNVISTFIPNLPATAMNQLQQPPITGINHGWMGVNTSTTSSFPANNFVNGTPQDARFLGLGFPSKAPLLVSNNINHQLGTLPSTNTSSCTNYLMTPAPATQIMPQMTTFPMTNSINNNESHPQALIDTPPIQDFNDALSNLLSTSLPSPEELFNDDIMSADGDISACLYGDDNEALGVRGGGGMMDLLGAGPFTSCG